jgi:predicted transposase YdaD
MTFPNNAIKYDAMSIVDELFEEGREIGIKIGIKIGREIGFAKVISAIKFWQKGMSIPAIAQKLDLSIVKVKKIIDNYKSDN